MASEGSDARIIRESWCTFAYMYIYTVVLEVSIHMICIYVYLIRFASHASQSSITFCLLEECAQEKTSTVNKIDKCEMRYERAWWNLESVRFVRRYPRNA